MKQDTEKIKGTILDYAYFPFRLVGDGKNYVLDTYSSEYKKCGADGVVSGTKAIITTGLVVTSDTLAWLSNYLGQKKEESTDYAAKKYGEAAHYAHEKSCADLNYASEKTEQAKNLAYQKKDEAKEMAYQKKDEAKEMASQAKETADKKNTEAKQTAKEKSGK